MTDHAPVDLVTSAIKSTEKSSETNNAKQAFVWDGMGLKHIQV